MFHKKGRKGGYIFTAKKHPEKGIMSTILGVISIASVAAAVYLSFRNEGRAAPQYGAAVLLATIFSLTGMVLGVLSAAEKERYRLFPFLGIGLNLLALAMVSIILYAGAYGI